MEDFPAPHELNPESQDEKVLYWASVTLSNYIKVGHYRPGMWDQLMR